MTEESANKVKDAVDADDSTLTKLGDNPKHPVFDVDMPAELDGPRGPEPTRYGDWEVKGRCSDF